MKYKRTKMKKNNRPQGMCIDKTLLNEGYINDYVQVCATIDLLDRAKLHFTCNTRSVG